MTECYQGPMMVPVKTVTALDVRRHFGRLLDEAAAGERIVIERAGTPLAALVSVRDLAAIAPERAVERGLAALDEIRLLAAEAPPAPAGWRADAFVRADRRRGARATDSSTGAQGRAGTRMAGEGAGEA